MSKIRYIMGGFAGAAIAGLCMIALLAFGAYLGLRDQQTTKAPPALAPQASGGTEKTSLAPVPTEEQAEVSAEAEAEAEAAIVPAPKFDELRREADGATVIAGRAAPMSDVRILVDGAEVARATADSTGGFAAFADLPAKATPQVVTLSAQDGAATTPSLDEIILAPSTPAPAPETAATPVPETQTAVEPVETAQAPEAATPEAEAPSQPVATATVVETEQAAGEAPQQAAEPEAEPARVAVLQSDEAGVRLLQPARPQAMTSIALDTIGYSDAGNVQLTGRAQSDARQVRVYLDNRAVVSLSVDDDGRWHGDLPDVDEGIYTLRVDEVTAAGVVSSRVETPFKRESPEALASAVQGPDGPVKAVTVQKGATLWAIARDRYGDGTLYVRVFEANTGSIRDPDLIYPGQVFDLPE